MIWLRWFWAFIGLLALAGQLRAQQTGQNNWCWVERSSSVMFCDYISQGSCWDANEGKQGTCVPRNRNDE